MRPATLNGGNVTQSQPLSLAVLSATSFGRSFAFSDDVVVTPVMMPRAAARFNIPFAASFGSSAYTSEPNISV